MAVTSLHADHFDEQVIILRIAGAEVRESIPQPMRPRTMNVEPYFAVRAEAGTW